MSRFDIHKQPADVVQLLDEHHLIALSDHADRREAFCDAIERFLGQVRNAEAVHIDGRAAETIEGFCTQLRLSLPPDYPVRPTIAGMVEALRHFPGEPMQRVFIWRDADTMLDHDVREFSRLINALFAVAAEQEHLTPGKLVIHRVVMTGGSKLGAFADAEDSPFQRWLVEDDDELNLWEAFSCVDHPRVLTYRIDG
jgi:hypothetical protein